MSSSASISSDLEAFNLGKNGQLNDISSASNNQGSSQALHSFLDMVLMGATDGYSDTQLREMDDRRKKIVKWSLEHGACQIWCGSQAAPEYVRPKLNDTNKELHMLGGPGEVAKGSFRRG
jgi:hypothetical protein